MKYLFIFCAFTFFKVKAQNIILNNSFEKYYVCPTTSGELYQCKDWLNLSWGTPDYFNSCSTSSLVNIPQNYYGYQNTNTGTAYSGIALYYPSILNAREYLEQKFFTPLAKGKKYCVNFYLNLADTCKFAIGSIGVLFTKDTLKSDTSSILPGIPQIQNPVTAFIEDKDNWVKISGVYIAQGGEQFITIGNFNNDANTPVKILTTGTQNYAYYYIDDVSLYQLIEAEAGEDKTICNGESATLGDAALPNTGYSWQPSIGLSNAAEAMPIANPTQTTTYTLTINYTGPNCTGKLSDTVTVHVNPCPNVYIANVFSPNNDGSNDVLKIEGNAIATLYFAVYNRWGNLVFETHSQTQTWDGTQKGTPCEAGVYVYYLQGKYTDGKAIEQKGTITLVR